MEKEINLLPSGEVDFAWLQQLVEEQSVHGLAAAGIEHIADIKILKKEVVMFIGRAV